MSDDGALSFKYGYCGPSTNHFLVLQDEKGDRTTVIAEHSLRKNPENRSQYVGIISFGDSKKMTLYAQFQKRRRSDSKDTIRMKRVILI